MYGQLLNLNFKFDAAAAALPILRAWDHPEPVLSLD
jgi:hypothetical protein